MIRRALCIALALSAGGALAHEEDFPTPHLAQGDANAVARIATPSERPRQPPGQTLPLQPTRTIKFETDEGTWMSVDASPDDQRVVFDLLGDLYTLDVQGGRAAPITGGLAFDAQPVFSPDGRWIAFVSDRSGAENLWLIRPDGSQPRQISFGDDDTVLVSPAWAPDGKSIYLSRFRWSLNNYELWRYEIDGAETLIVPIDAPPLPHTGRISSLGAVVAPDGRDVYFARRTGDADDGVWSI
ncbi:MAG: TolB family protein, partial [Steroidobacter sp.]